MSLFINQLAFPEAPWLLEQARFGILAASAISAGMGLIWLYSLPRYPKDDRADSSEPLVMGEGIFPGRFDEDGRELAPTGITLRQVRVLARLSP